MKLDLSVEQSNLVARAQAALASVPASATARVHLEELAGLDLVEALAADPAARVEVLLAVATRDGGLAAAMGSHFSCVEAISKAAPLRASFTRAEKIGCIESAVTRARLSDGAKSPSVPTSRVIGAANADYIVCGVPGDDSGARLRLVDLSQPDVSRQLVDLGGLARAGVADVFIPVDPAGGVEVPSAMPAGALRSGLDLVVAACAIGIGRAALEVTVRALQAAGARGGPVSASQAEEFAASDTATELEAARLTTMAAASMRAEGHSRGPESASARWLATEAATAGVARAIQVTGAPSLALLQWQIDAHVLSTLGGTSFDALEAIAAGTLGEP